MNKANNVVVIVVWFASLLAMYQTTSYFNEKRTARQLQHYVLNDSTMQVKLKSIRDSAGRQINIYALNAVQANDLLRSSSEEVQQLRADLSKAGLKLKEVHSSVTVTTTTQDKVGIAVGDTIGCKVDDKDTTRYAKVVVPFTDTTDKFMRIQGNAIMQPVVGGVVLDSLNIDYCLKASNSITHVYDRKLLRPTQLKLMVTADNPKTTINKVQSYFVTVDKKWYEKWYVHVLVGAGAGVYLMTIAR